MLQTASQMASGRVRRLFLNWRVPG